MAPCGIRKTNHAKNINKDLILRQKNVRVPRARLRARAYTPTFVSARTYTYTDARARTYTHTDAHVCARVCSLTQERAQTHMGARARVRAGARARAHEHTRARARARTHAPPPLPPPPRQVWTQMQADADLARQAVANLEEALALFQDECSRPDIFDAGTFLEACKSVFLQLLKAAHEYVLVLAMSIDKAIIVPVARLFVADMKTGEMRKLVITKTRSELNFTSK